MPEVVLRQAPDHRQHMTAYVLPTLGDVALATLRAEELFELRNTLATRLGPKTVRNVIDGTFRAFYRDARDPPAETTPLQACLDSFTMLPDCTVAKYEACLNEAKKDACGAAATSACQELMTCPGMGLRTGLGMSEAAAGILCSVELGTTFGIAALVWDMRMLIDESFYCTPAHVYCIEYSMVCDH